MYYGVDFAGWIAIAGGIIGMAIVIWESATYKK